MKKRITACVWLTAVVMLIFGACAPAQKTSETYALDTICTQQVTGQNADAAIGDVNAMLARITKELSTNEGSYIYDVNQSGTKGASVSDEAAQLVLDALRFAADTDGAFDPTIGAVSLLWNISQTPRVPSPEEISAALPLVNFRDVTVNGSTVTLEKGGMRLDLGGIGKGYAADLAVQIYKQHGIDTAILNLGGNVYVYGDKQDGSDYRIGLRDPLGSENDVAAVIPVKNTSVVTSGVYERFFESGGKTYHHLIDPKTGYPADNGLLAVTVVCDSSNKADALSTALFVMGLSGGLDYAKRTPGIEAVFFTNDKGIYVTSGLEDKIEITNEAYTLKS